MHEKPTLDPESVAMRVGRYAAESQDAIGDVALCPHCLNPRPHDANFCPTCAAPLTFFAGTDPIASIWASAWILWQAALTRWPPRISFLGALFVLLPSTAGVLAFFVFVLLGHGSGEPWEVIAGLLLHGLLSLLAAVLLTRIIFNYLARSRDEPWPAASN